MCHVMLHNMCHVMDGPLENLWGGGRAKYKKKYSRKGKLNEKNSCRQLILKNIHAMALKKFIQGI